MDRIPHTEPKKIAALLVGRSIVKVEMGQKEYYGEHWYNGTMTLDDGTVLRIDGNEGCGGCEGGHFLLTDLEQFDNRIMKVKVKETNHTNPDKTVFEMFVYGAGAKPKATRVLAVEGNEGSGYYGVGFKISVSAA